MLTTFQMLDFGIQERWPARHCARKWQEMETTAATTATIGYTPATAHGAQYSSPVESATHFAFLPMQ